MPCGDALRDEGSGRVGTFGDLGSLRDTHARGGLDLQRLNLGRPISGRTCGSCVSVESCELGAKADPPPTAKDDNQKSNDNDNNKSNDNDNDKSNGNGNDQQQRQQQQQQQQQQQMQMQMRGSFPFAVLRVRMTFEGW
jgi:hypothetical protein